MYFRTELIRPKFSRAINNKIKKKFLIKNNVILTLTSRFPQLQYWFVSLEANLSLENQTIVKVYTLSAVRKFLLLRFDNFEKRLCSGRRVES